MKIVQNIVEAGLCLGCGLCEAIVGKEKCEMVISDKGFYQPYFKADIGEDGNRKILASCPAISVQGEAQSGVWGKCLSVVESWSKDSLLRKKSATGGVVSSLAIYLLESKKVDAILQVGLKDRDWLHNELLISRTKDDVIRNAQSRYAPALVFDRIIDIFKSSQESFGFIGKPCDIAGLKNILTLYPEYKSKIKFTIAIFCAGIPSYNASRELVAQAAETEEPVFLKYRGNGWPGDFEVRWESGKFLKVSYNDSWGKVLGRSLGLRCKICPDGIGLLADIATGDSWNTKNGYPDFTEADGRNFCFIRTPEGKEVFERAVELGYVTSNYLNVSKLKEMHRYQYYRRISAGWRIAAVQLFSFGILKFSNLGVNSLMFRKNPLKGVKEFLGTIKRF